MSFTTYRILLLLLLFSNSCALVDGPTYETIPEPAKNVLQTGILQVFYLTNGMFFIFLDFWDFPSQDIDF